MIRRIPLMLIGLSAFALACAGGCEREVPRTAQNIAGSWQAPFADVVATINLGPNGTYVIETDTEGTAGSQLFGVGPWGKVPPMGNWRLGEDEIVFSDGDGVTIGGLEIAALYEDKVLFEANDGSKMFFNKVTARPTPPPLTPPAGGAGGAGDGGN